MKGVFLLFLSFYMFMNEGFSQEIVHPFHVGKGGCIAKVEEFLKKGMNANTCVEIKNWVDGLEAMTNGECQRVFTFAKLSDSGNRTAFDVISKQIVEKINKLNCDDNGNSRNSNRGNANATSSQSSYQSSNQTSDFYRLSEAMDMLNRREADRQKMIADDKGPNKYSFSGNIDQNKIRSDVLIMNNDTEVKALIVKITEEQITYKKAVLPDGPTFVVKISSIKKIVFQNGTELILNK